VISQFFSLPAVVIIRSPAIFVNQGETELNFLTPGYNSGSRTRLKKVNKNLVKKASIKSVVRIVQKWGKKLFINYRS